MPENIQALRQRPVDLGASPLLASTQAKYAACMMLCCLGPNSECALNRTSSSAISLEKENVVRGESKVSVKVEPKVCYHVWQFKDDFCVPLNSLLE